MNIYYNGTPERRLAAAKKDFPNIDVLSVKDLTVKVVNTLEAYLDYPVFIELQGAKVIDQTRLLKLCESKPAFVQLSIGSLPFVILPLRDRAARLIDLGAAADFSRLYPIYYGFGNSQYSKDEAIYSLSCLLYLWAPDNTVTPTIRTALDDVISGVPVVTVLSTLDRVLKGRVAVDTTRRIQC